MKKPSCFLTLHYLFKLFNDSAKIYKKYDHRFGWFLHGVVLQYLCELNIFLKYFFRETHAPLVSIAYSMGFNLFCVGELFLQAEQLEYENLQGSKILLPNKGRNTNLLNFLIRSKMK